MKKIEINEYEIAALQRGCNTAIKTVMALAQVLARVLEKHGDKPGTKALINSAAKGLQDIDKRLLAVRAFLNDLSSKTFWAEESEGSDDENGIFIATGG